MLNNQLINLTVPTIINPLINEIQNNTIDFASLFITNEFYLKKSREEIFNNEMPLNNCQDCWHKLLLMANYITTDNYKDIIMEKLNCMLMKTDDIIIKSIQEVTQRYLSLRDFNKTKSEFERVVKVARTIKNTNYDIMELKDLANVFNDLKVTGSSAFSKDANDIDVVSMNSSLYKDVKALADWCQINSKRYLNFSLIQRNPSQKGTIIEMIEKANFSKAHSFAKYFNQNVQNIGIRIKLKNNKSVDITQAVFNSGFVLTEIISKNSQLIDIVKSVCLENKNLKIYSKLMPVLMFSICKFGNPFKIFERKVLNWNDKCFISNENFE
jgi:hypothetical protein